MGAKKGTFKAYGFDQICVFVKIVKLTDPLWPQRCAKSYPYG